MDKHPMPYNMQPLADTNDEGLESVVRDNFREKVTNSESDVL